MSEAVSFVATLRDEAGSVEAFVASVLAQTRPPDEIVLVDDGSTDGTGAALERLRAADARIQVHATPGVGISHGRNLAIGKAAGPLIAVADAGTTLRPDWLATIVAPLEDDEAVGVSAGYFEPVGSTLFERVLGAVVSPHPDELDEATFLPHSRSVAFRKSWWQRVGGYPEWLRHCEDLVFDLALKRAGAAFAFRPGAVVRWRARPTLGQFAKQYFLYARGDGHAALWAKRHLVRYGSYAAGAALLVAGASTPVAYLGLAGGAAVHFGRFYRRLARWSPAHGAELAAAAALVPVIVVTGDLAKMIGYPLGLLERGRVTRDRRPPTTTTDNPDETTDDPRDES
jgi:glycosyltransferase involved in cell wall biosynthesis